MRTWADVYWPVWFLLLFGVPEAIALRTHHTEWTLSGWIWRVCDVLPGSTLLQWTALHIFLAAFLLWLLVHMVFGIWR